ncbi:DUF3231 family protein [Bacillus alkalicellulosilyticus]|nr:DUF3231 family protein [Bacillus alkalicellulosilyticus]
MQEHKINLTAAEIGSIWASFMTEGGTILVLTYF